VESEIDFLICCDLGKGKGKGKGKGGKGKGGVSGGEWGMERRVLTQQSAGSGEWKWREIGPISAILTSWTDFTRV